MNQSIFNNLHVAMFCHYEVSYIKKYPCRSYGLDFIPRCSVLYKANPKKVLNIARYKSTENQSKKSFQSALIRNRKDSVRIELKTLFVSIRTKSMGLSRINFQPISIERDSNLSFGLVRKYIFNWSVMKSYPKISVG